MTDNRTHVKDHRVNKMDQLEKKVITGGDYQNKTGSTNTTDCDKRQM